MIGIKIKEMRQEKGYSISELANIADVSKSYLSHIERGLQSNPSLQFLYKVAKALGTNLEYLLEKEQTENDAPIELDDEWVVLIRGAVEDGLKKEDFREYLNYIKFQAWMKEQMSK
ncbi:helix-turn-helix domain-containing protein [Neobacillus sp. NRS-1170]|uniref:helix-turn-helix domain-containing protein n=1 Tax=Neobacillus sp. NRS-1170 TaxID=3233898 RepID=UPI003D273184